MPRLEKSQVVEIKKEIRKYIDEGKDVNTKKIGILFNISRMMISNYVRICRNEFERERLVSKFESIVNDRTVERVINMNDVDFKSDLISFVFDNSPHEYFRKLLDYHRENEKMNLTLNVFKMIPKISCLSDLMQSSEDEDDKKDDKKDDCRLVYRFSIVEIDEDFIFEIRYEDRKILEKLFCVV